MSHGGQVTSSRVSTASLSEPSPASTPNDTDCSADSDVFLDPNFLSPNMLPAMLFRITPLSCHASASNSQLRSLNDPKIEDYADEEGLGYINPYADPWSITQADYEKLCHSVQEYSDVLPRACSLPPRPELSIYVEKYLICVQEFLPFIHTATFVVVEKDIELLLVVAALGSLYKFQKPNAYLLYSMSKAIMMEKLRRENIELAADLLSEQDHSTWQKRKDLSKMQTLVLLLTFSSWADRRVSQDSIALGSQLAMLVRKNGILESDELVLDVGWLDWVEREEKRRTLLAAYLTFNMLSTAFDIPPLILNHEIQICLPSFAKRWRARDAIQWQDAPRQVERRFRDAFLSLFSGTEFSHGPVSAFSNYILVHALINQIFIDRHGSSGLQLGTINAFETALRTWKVSWEHTFEATIDLNVPKGPLGLAGVTLFRLAHIRLCSDYGPCRGVLARNPQCILAPRHSLQRSPCVDKAVLHAAHALAIPMRLGIDLVASSKTPVWTTEHSLCSLECALLLNDWFGMIAVASRSCGTDGLRPVERQLLGVLTGIIRESSFTDSLDLDEIDESHIARMGRTVVKLWAQIFEGAHLYEIDNFVGASLQVLADSTPT